MKRWMKYLVVEEHYEGVDEVGGVGEAGEGAEGGQGQHLDISSASIAGLIC